MPGLFDRSPYESPDVQVFRTPGASLRAPAVTSPERGALGARIRAARERGHLSLRRLAGQIGVSPSTLSAIENGRTGVSAIRLALIAELLGEPLGRLLPPVLPPAGDGRLEGAGAQSGWRQFPPLRLDPPLTAALSTFVEVGYHAATMRSIAGRAGLSVPGIYHHYPSKQALLAGLLDFTMADLLKRSRAARAEGSDPVTRFTLLVECLALHHTHRRDLGFIGASEMRSLEPANRRRVAAARTAQQRMVDEEVAAAVADGSFTTGLPHEAARAVVTMCTGLVHWFHPGGTITPEGVARQYVDFALAVVGHRPRD